MADLTPMKGDEFVAKLLAGERDFRRIKLEEGCDLSAHERYDALRAFLVNAQGDLKENPVKLIGADLSFLTAPNLYLPYTKAAGTVLAHADLHGSTFDYSDFSEADLSYSNLNNAYFRRSTLTEANLVAANLHNSWLTFANFSNANLSCANLYAALLGDANLSGTNFDRADLSDANLKGVKNLGKAKYLSRAHFLNTEISREDIAVCKKALEQRNSLIYRSFWA